MTMDRDHTHAFGHAPSRQRKGFETPIAALWSLTKDGAERHAFLHSHEMGFELRIVDARHEAVFTQVRGAEADIVMLAATHQDAYRADGWERLESPS